MCPDYIVIEKTGVHSELLLTRFSRVRSIDASSNGSSLLNPIKILAMKNQIPRWLTTAAEAFDASDQHQITELCDVINALYIVCMMTHCFEPLFHSMRNQHIILFGKGRPHLNSSLDKKHSQCERYLSLILSDH